MTSIHQGGESTVEPFVGLERPAASRRPIPALQIASFSAIFTASATVSAGVAVWAFQAMGHGEFSAILTVIVGLLTLLALLVVSYRLLLGLSPNRPGEIAPGTRQEFVRNVSVLFHLMAFNSITKSWLLPVPLMTAFYSALGAKLGRNTFIAGMLFDPDWVAIGDDSLVGHNATLIPHVLENGRYALFPIRIGSNCTIGAGAIVMAGVTVGDGAIIAAGSIVTKGKVVGPGETWVGIPARRLLPRSPADPVSHPSSIRRSA